MKKVGLKKILNLKRGNGKQFHQKYILAYHRTIASLSLSDKYLLLRDVGRCKHFLGPVESSPLVGLLKLAAEKKTPFCSARRIFGPSYFVKALVVYRVVVSRQAMTPPPLPPTSF